MNSSATSLTSFIPLTKLGQGTFSSVYKVKRMNDQKIYALKKIKMSSLKEKERLNALNEIRILASLSNRYIVSYKEAFFDEKLQLLCIIMEWACDGDLHHKINQHKAKNEHIPESQIWKAAYQICQGLSTLHSHNILHRDLKSANIFISNGVYKLGDLNVSKVNHQNRLAKTQTGTPFYASPQIWRDQPYDQKSDIWSFGCILYEMCKFRPPFLGNDLDQLYKSIQKGYIEPIPSCYSRQLDTLIRTCLKMRSSERYSASQLLHPSNQIIQKCEFYEIQVESAPRNITKSALLQTIKMPRDMKQLKNKLPISNYDTNNTTTKQVGKLYSPQPPPKQHSEPQTSSASKNTTLKQKVLSQQLPSHYNHNNKRQVQQNQERIPLPEKIKSHLQNINKNSEKQLNNIRRIHSSKYRVHSNIAQQQKEMMSKKIDEYYANNKQHREHETKDRKKRPLSTNIHKNQYHINKFNQRPISANHVYVSDRKPNRSSNKLLPSSNMSDRKEPAMGGANRYRYDKIYVDRLKDKERCQSANYDHSSLGQLQKRLDIRCKNIQSNYPSNNAIVSKYRIRSAVSNPSLACDPNIAPKPVLKNYSGIIERNSSDRKDVGYLKQIQNKIMAGSKRTKYVPGAASSKFVGALNRYGLNPVNSANAGNSDSRIRRITKANNIFRNGIKN